MSNESVGYSRAGDEFHYRWAARRCLRLIYPNTSLQSIVVEGSAEAEKAGELVIDVSEYSYESNGGKKINYYQLKHTTVQHDEPFTISDLKKTFKGFSERFIQHLKNGGTANISFAIITNRKFDVSFKNRIEDIANGSLTNQGFKTTIEKYTRLTGKELSSFCSLLHLEDSEGNYQVQEKELKFELAQVLASQVDPTVINNIVELVRSKVLPGSDGKILKEEVLYRFQITSERELYPAPAVWDKLENVVTRKQYVTLTERILQSAHQVIVHAAGGVGKSVFCRQVINLLPEGSIGIAYDCFGAGKYRNPSEPRHGHRHALVQIANELATKGLCAPLIPFDTSREENITSTFLLKVKAASEAIRNANESAKLVILIDAADNAEMAASEYSQRCFAHELLLETMPDGCKFVFLCRTERIHLLKPKSIVTQLELESFSKEESGDYLKGWFPEVTEHDIVEFYRLTSGNPRAQATALANNYLSVEKLLFSLGPSGTSVEKQIEAQIEVAISKVKDELPPNYRGYVDSICLGLASLPPHIPIDVLSKAANVDANTVKSFVADINRALWMTESSVQFRDEPTETWFRNHFSAKHGDFVQYIQQLEPLAHQSAYVGEVLPQLYLQSQQYGKLINLALSDEYLPDNKPIDARNIKVYRLQFAFRAALKAKQYADAIKLAMRAGEETAGNSRQLSVLQSNIDLLTHLQSKEKIQEIAFKQSLRSQWSGSENIYTASLLSGINEYRGEARGYLRSARNWLSIQFEEQRKKKDLYGENRIKDRDILEIAYATLNILGVQECLQFLFELQPVEAVFRIVQAFVRRLIDINRFEEINELLAHCIQKPYFTVALVSELFEIGVVPKKPHIETCLLLLAVPNKQRIKKKKDTFQDSITPAIVSFVEACVYQNLSSAAILKVMSYYLPVRASRLVYSSHQSVERTTYLKVLAIRTLLAGKTEIEFEKILPEELVGKEKEYKHENDFRELKEVVYSLFPWFFLRAQILSNTSIILPNAADTANKASAKGKGNRYGRYDALPNETADVCFSILTISYSSTQNDIRHFYNQFLHHNKAFNIKIRLSAVRTAYRASHLAPIRQELERSTLQLVDNYRNSDPDDIAAQYVSLSRAVLIEPYDDASEYFDRAVKIVSKFGDELVQRWEAVVSLAKKACAAHNTSNELAYRFVRCAELIGDNVGREKYWNRSEAIKVCTRMSTGIGISALSRWRDRDIGRFEYQLEALLLELTRSKLIKPATGWALTRFFSSHDLDKFLSQCLENEISVEMKQKILEDAIYLLQLEGANKEYWDKLKGIADNFHLNNNSLNAITDFHSKQNETSETSPIETPVNAAPNTIPTDNKWDEIFQGLDVTTLEGFSKVVERFTAKSERDEFRWKIRELLKEALARVDKKHIWNYIDNLLSIDSVNHYDVQETLGKLPKEWTNKVSFKGKWNRFIHRFGQRFADELTNRYAFNSFVEKFNCDEFSIGNLKEGILSGLANQFELSGTDTFFGFVGSAIPFVNSDQAKNLLDYAISRFELHMEDDFGDGTWDDWLHVSVDNNRSVAGFIWSALGSPRSAVRWRAAHSVRALADFDCTEVLDSLIAWLAHNEVDAFGSKQFPFYNLHARQYLLIALARVAVHKPSILYRYAEVFPKYALDESHVVIQKFASDVIVAIETSFPGTYSDVALQSVKSVGKSQLPIQEEDYNYTTDSYWHKNKLVDTNVEFHFGWDFDRYWYEPLGNVFGLPEKQIQDLAANVIVKEWGIKDKNGYNNDPRVILWDNSSSERETWHDHGSYPKTDNLDFYLSYHSMLVVAAKLIEKMPIISTRNHYEDSNAWEYWLSGHLLSRNDRKWLFDAKTPLPLQRPVWIAKEPDKEWKTNIAEGDFFDCIIENENKEPWVYVKGYWHEKQNDNIETFFVSTAMVSKITSDALLRALTTCQDPNDYKLPHQEERDMEIESGSFTLKGWIKKRSGSKHLDQFDPYADNIQYPHYILGDNVRERLNLQVSSDGRNWSFADSGDIALVCESWSGDRGGRDEEPDQSGLRLKASLRFLKLLCSSFDCELIFEVGIKRDVIYRYRSNDEKREYAKPQHKIFIFSADGRFRTTNKSYQLGQANG